MTINPVEANPPALAAPDKPKDLGAAAKSFEALLIGQILKSVSESPSGGGWMGTGEEDQTGSQALAIAQEQFAQALAAGGGLGLAKMVTRSVTSARSDK